MTLKKESLDSNKSHKNASPEVRARMKEERSAIPEVFQTSAQAFREASKIQKEQKKKRNFLVKAVEMPQGKRYQIIWS